MNKKFLVIILAISVTINLIAIFTLGYYWWEIHSHKRGFMPRWIGRGDSPLKNELNLTDEQIGVINSFQEEMRLKILPYREELFTKRRELMKLLKNGEPNKEKADSLFQEIATLQIELESHIFEGLWYIRSILTSEQRLKLETLMHDLFESHKPPGPPPPHMSHPPHGHRP